jgi:hypothetical protein
VALPKLWPLTAAGSLPLDRFGVASLRGYEKVDYMTIITSRCRGMYVSRYDVARGPWFDAAMLLVVCAIGLPRLGINQSPTFSFEFVPIPRPNH